MTLTTRSWTRLVRGWLTHAVAMPSWHQACFRGMVQFVMQFVMQLVM